MKMAATSSAALLFAVAAMPVCLALTACSSSRYEPLFTEPSPDGAFVARAELREEGTLGSSRYRLSVSTADGTQGSVVFRGENGWAGSPVWLNSSTLIVPFCFGSISSLRSVLALQGSDVVRYRTSSSANIRVHVVTAPQTSISGREFCTTDAFLEQDGTDSLSPEAQEFQ